MELPQVYKENFLIIELLIAAIIVGALYLIMVIFIAPDQFIIFLEKFQTSIYSITSVGAITLLGFIITGISILITFTETPSLRPLKTSNQYSTLFKIYFSAIKHLGALTIVSIFGMLVLTPWIAVIIFYVCIFLFLTSIFRIWRCLWVLQKFIEIIQATSSNQTNQSQ
jgi:hypothetical protein